MTETTEKQKEMAERYHSTDSKDLKIKSLEAQVTSLTKERGELKDVVIGLRRDLQISNNTWSDQVDKITYLKSQLSNRDKQIEELKEKFDQAKLLYFVEDEEQLESPDDVADYWDCPIGGTLDIQSCKVFFRPTQTYIRTEEGMVLVQSKEGEE